MKYLTGCIVSGLLHMPLLDEKEYASYVFATACWPVPLALASMYIHYVVWGNYKHRKLFPDQNRLAEAEAQDNIA